MLTSGICVSRQDNAIHNISIPGGDIDPRGKRLFGGDDGAIL
jgi:hypothetical protein